MPPKAKPQHSLGWTAQHVREGKALSQVKVARAARLSASKLCNFEHGKADLYVDEAMRLAMALGLSLIDLLRLGLGGGSITVNIPPPPDNDAKEKRAGKRKGWGEQGDAPQG